MNYALRDLRHNFGRFAMTCVGLSLLLGVVQSMVGIYRGLVEEALVVARAPAADLWVVEAGTQGPFAEASRIPGDTREAVARIEAIAAAGSLTFQSTEADRGGTRLRLYVVGFERGRPGEPEDIVDGRPIVRSHFELIVDRRAGLALGEQIRIGRNAFTVVGLVAGHSASGGDPVAYMMLLDAQRLQFELEPPAARIQSARGAPRTQTDTINAVVARLMPGEDAAAVAAVIARWKHLAAMPQDVQEGLLTHSLVDRARRQIGLFTVTLLAVSGVIIALVIYTMTMDKLREIATLKLIGAPNRVIVGLILQQTLAMGIAGWAIGRIIVAFAADIFPRRVALLPADTAGLFVIVVLLCLAASALSVRVALRVDPATALGG